MKQLLIYSVLTITLFFSVAFVNRQEPKKLTVSMPLDNWNYIINIIDDAPLDGKTRKALIKELTDQLIPQLPKDSTKIKK